MPFFSFKKERRKLGMGWRRVVRDIEGISDRGEDFHEGVKTA